MIREVIFESFVTVRQVARVLHFVFYTIKVNAQTLLIAKNMKHRASGITAFPTRPVNSVWFDNHNACNFVRLVLFR